PARRYVEAAGRYFRAQADEEEAEHAGQQSGQAGVLERIVEIHGSLRRRRLESVGPIFRERLCAFGIVCRGRHVLVSGNHQTFSTSGLPSMPDGRNISTMARIEKAATSLYSTVK